MKSLLSLLVILLPFTAMAQYYNPYFNPNHDLETCSGKARCNACYGTGICYGYQCMSCGGTGMVNCPMCAGARMAKQHIEQMKEQRWNSASNTFEDGLNALMEKSYSSALKYFKRSARLGNNPAIAYIGNMYELGMGVGVNTETAKAWYIKGNNRGDNLSASNLKRVKQYGFWKANATNRSTYIQNLKNLSNMAAIMSQQIVDGMDWESSSGSSGSSKRRSSGGICSSCGGTGVSPTPNSGGSRSSWVAHYNSQGNKCPYCGSYTKHFHDKCSSCNVPRY